MLVKCAQVQLQQGFDDGVHSFGEHLKDVF